MYTDFLDGNFSTKQKLYRFPGFFAKILKTYVQKAPLKGPPCHCVQPKVTIAEITEDNDSEWTLLEQIS